MSQTLSQLLAQKKIIRSVGAHDVFSALVAQQCGFQTIFVGGFGTAASLLGQPDMNLVTLSEMADAVRRMAGRLSVPIIADGDTGHGGPQNVRRTVREFERAGAAGIVLEDQVFPKRCGHFEGKAVIPAREMVMKLTVAREARVNRNFHIVARTDARDVNGLADAIQRVNLYHRAGADVVFIESPHTRDELELIPKKVKAPLLVNMLTGGKTPNLPVSELGKMGYAIVVYPIESLLLLAQGMRRLSRAILGEGSVDSVQNQMVSFAEVKSILGLDTMMALDTPRKKRKSK